MKIVNISMELVIPDEDDNFNTDSDDAICDYLNDKLYNDPEYFGDFGPENITGVITCVEQSDTYWVLCILLLRVSKYNL